MSSVSKALESVGNCTSQLLSHQIQQLWSWNKDIEREKLTKEGQNGEEILPNGTYQEL